MVDPHAPHRPPPVPPHARAEALASIGDALDRLKFGDIRLTVHDGRIVQLEVTEKKRFSA